MLDQASQGLSYGPYLPDLPDSIMSGAGMCMLITARAVSQYIGMHHGAGAGWPLVSGRRHAVRHDHGGHAFHTSDLDCHRYHDGHGHGHGHDHGEIVA